MLSPGGLSERELEAVDKMRKDRMPEIQREDAVRYIKDLTAERTTHLRRIYKIESVVQSVCEQYNLDPDELK